MKQNKFWLKLTGTALLLHVILILLSIIEVAIYSYLINPGKEQEFYAAHATVSGPWISAVFGSLLMFLFSRRYLKKFNTHHLTYVIGLPAIYLVLDLLMIIAAGYDLIDFLPTFALSSAPKIAAVAIAYFFIQS